MLIVEDSPVDAELLEMELRNGGFSPQALHVDDAAGMRDALQADWDLILCDYSMPRFDGVEALGVLNASGRDIPFMLISGSLAEDWPGRRYAPARTTSSSRGSSASSFRCATRRAIDARRPQRSWIRASSTRRTCG